MSTYTARPNRYAGDCVSCGHTVAAGTGLLAGRPGAWGAQHLDGDCSTTPPPAPTAPVRAEEGFYVRGDEAFKVQWNQARTGTYAKRFTVEGGKASWEYVPGVGRSLAEDGLTPMTAGDAARIGLSHGFCINCCRTLGGTTLSAHVSALIGYGETCARTNGWTYPRGAAAQREFVASHA